MTISQEKIETVIWQENEISSDGMETKLLELPKELLKLPNSKEDYNSVADKTDRLWGIK